MASKYWIKLYHEILHDHKMGTMPDRLWRRTIEIFLMAGEYDRDGELPPVEEMAWTLRISNDECNESLHELQRLCIVYCNDNATWVVTNFKERQDASTGTERSRESRRRKRQNEDKNTEKQPKNDDSDATITQRNVAPDTDTDTDTDNRNIGVPSPPISKVTKPKKVKPEKPPIPPAILAYQRTAQYYPEKAIWETIVATVGDTPAGLQLWTDIIKAWILLGWNKRNASGMLDFYSRGEIPGKGNNHNGQTSATATGSGNSIGSGTNGSQGSDLDDVSKQLAAAFLKKSRPIVPRT